MLSPSKSHLLVLLMSSLPHESLLADEEGARKALQICWCSCGVGGSWLQKGDRATGMNCRHWWWWGERQLIKGAEQAPEAETTCPLPQSTVSRSPVLAVVRALCSEPSLGEQRLWVSMCLGCGKTQGFAARMRKGPSGAAGGSHCNGGCAHCGGWGGHAVAVGPWGGGALVGIPTWCGAPW